MCVWEFRSTCYFSEIMIHSCHTFQMFSMIDKLSSSHPSWRVCCHQSFYVPSLVRLATCLTAVAPSLGCFCSMLSPFYTSLPSGVWLCSIWESVCWLFGTRLVHFLMRNMVEELWMDAAGWSMCVWVCVWVCLCVLGNRMWKKFFISRMNKTSQCFPAALKHMPLFIMTLFDG